MSSAERAWRGSGYYATYGGREYRAWLLREGRVRLFSNDEPLPAGFEPSRRQRARGERLMPMDEVERLVKVRTTCQWRGHPFEIGSDTAGTAFVTYLGVNFDEVCGLPGMSRPDKYEVMGEVPVSELSDIEEQSEDVS